MLRTILTVIPSLNMKHPVFQLRLQTLGLATATAVHLAASSQPSFDVLSAGGGLSDFGRSITGPLLAVPDGSFFAVATFGGPLGKGVLLHLGSGDLQPTRIHAFNTLDGSGTTPVGGVALGKDGFLYGTTKFGGPDKNYSFGTIYRIQTNGTGYTTLHQFGSLTNDGTLPVGPLTVLPDGQVFGVTTQGGATGNGILYRMHGDGSAYQIVHSFGSDSNDGKSPLGGMVVGADGAVYGTTSDGGAHGGGTVFRISPTGTDYSILSDLPESGGPNGGPASGLLSLLDGTLLGTSRSGATNGGYLFALRIDGSNFGILHEYPPYPYDTNAHSPASTLVQSADGTVYGITSADQFIDSISIFSLSAPKWEYKELVNLPSQRRGQNYLLTPLGDGMLYLVPTPNPNLYQPVDVLQFDSMTKTLTPKLKLSTYDKSFKAAGIEGLSTLVEGNDHALYLLAFGDNGSTDALLRLTKDGQTMEVVHSFPFTTGNGPTLNLNLARDRSGVLHGSWVANLSTGDYSTANFSYDPSSRTYSNLATNYSWLSSHLEVGPDARWYGSALGGNSILFSSESSGDGFHSLLNLPGRAWITPSPDYNLYGLASVSMDTSPRRVFRMNMDGSGFNVLADVARLTEGLSNVVNIVLADDQFLYGVASAGGSFGLGGVFRVAVDGSAFQVLHTFKNENGPTSLPSGILVADDGFIYGISSLIASGGTTYGGFVYRLSRDGSIYEEFPDSRAIYFTNPTIQGSDGAIYAENRLGRCGRFVIPDRITVSNLPPVFVATGSSMVLEIPTNAFLNPLPNQPLMFSVSGIPEGLVVDKSGRTVSGTIAKSGQYSLLVTGTDPSSPGRSASLTWTWVATPNQGILLRGIGRTYDGHPVVQGVAMPGVSYTVQAADLLNGPWSDVGSATADTEGNLAVVDSSSGTKGTRFYRVRSGL
jgi:uncharacterized repeat protein (TIGR03803 family)